MVGSTLILLAICGGVKCANQVLLVSMDGFRWDYLNKVYTPNFDRLAKRGAKAQYINSTFITKTFPCHYSIITGLYEESHGIIGNKMYDPEFNETFKLSTTASKWWDGGEPVWVTARRQNLTSATHFWPGSDAIIRGYRPNIWIPYNELIPFEQRVDTVIGWLTVEQIDFVTLYFEEPDSTGHKFGPDSPEVKTKVKEMDKVLGYLLDNFESNNLWDKVNLILTSDHGMATIDTSNKVIDITDYVNMTAVHFTVDSGPIMHIQPVVGKTDYVVRSLQNVSHLSVFKKENIPDYWHYKNNRRIMPVFLVAEEGWSITTNKSVLSLYRGKGNHGYNNQLFSMKPIFLARGPNITENVKAPTFRNVDIYPLICDLLGINPSPNNGSLLATKSFITSSKDTNVAGESKSSRWLILFLCISGYSAYM